eukprot:g31826.t1
MQQRLWTLTTFQQWYRKTYTPELAIPLVMLFQNMYNTGIYLTMGKIDKVCLAHAEQDKSNPANYCPIGLLTIISKVTEGVINSAIKQHPLSHNMLIGAQFGFCQGHSAPELIAALVQTWTKDMNSRGD